MKNGSDRARGVHPQAATAKRGRPPEESVTGKRTRGKNDVVALTVRLRRADWERLHQFAVTEGVSLQQLAHDGFSRLLVEKGLPGLN